MAADARCARRDSMPSNSVSGYGVRIAFGPDSLGETVATVHYSTPLIG